MKVAVTGGIGAGKSEFMRAVKELGIRTYSADEINAELLRDKRYIEKLSAAFPLAVKDGKVAVTSASCPSQDCVKHGFSDRGAPIVCLPNRLTIEFSSDASYDALIG